MAESGINKIALIVGHTVNKKGAESYNGKREWDWNKKVAEEVMIYMAKEFPGKTVKTFYRPDMVYRAAVSRVGREVGEWGADLSLELHFNSIGHKINAYGCEVLMNVGALYGDQTLKIADQITDALARDFNLRERDGDGVVVLKKGQRGYYNIKYCLDYGVKVALLIEPMFAGTRTHESEQFFETELGLMKYAHLLGDQLGGL